MFTHQQRKKGTMLRPRFAAAAAMLVGLLATAVQAAPCPGLTMAITTKPTAKAGGLHRFRVRIANTGAATLSPVAVLLTLPGGFSAAHSSGKGMVAEGRNVTWTGLSLGPRKSKALTITAKADLCPPSPSLPAVATGSASVGSSCAMPATPSGPVTTKQTAKSAKATCTPAPTPPPTASTTYLPCEAGRALTNFDVAGSFPTAQGCANGASTLIGSRIGKDGFGSDSQRLPELVLVSKWVNFPRFSPSTRTACNNNFPSRPFMSYNASSGNCQCSDNYVCDFFSGWASFALRTTVCLAPCAAPAP